LYSCSYYLVNRRNQIVRSASYLGSGLKHDHPYPLLKTIHILKVTMIDPISVVGTGISFIAYVIAAINIAPGFFRSSGPVLLLSKEQEKWEPSYFLKLCAPQLVLQLKSLFEIVLCGSDEVLECFRTSYSLDCSMVAVAVG
jgi:hypothetical protein